MIFKNELKKLEQLVQDIHNESCGLESFQDLLAKVSEHYEDENFEYDEDNDELCGGWEDENKYSNRDVVYKAKLFGKTIYFSGYESRSGSYFSSYEYTHGFHEILTEKEYLKPDINYETVYRDFRVLFLSDNTVAIQHGEDKKEIYISLEKAIEAIEKKL